MIRSLQTRLLLTVGALAMMAVVAVALVARQGTRQGLRRFQEIERSADTAKSVSASTNVAGILEGRCCPPEVMAEAARLLAPTTALLVTDQANGGLIASAGAPVAAARVTTTRSGDTLQVDVTTEDQGRQEVGRLRFASRGTPVRLADGTQASYYVVPFPNPERGLHVAAILHAVDLRLVWATAIIGAVALVITWAIARSSVRPLQELRAATRDVASGRLKTRVRPRGSREIVDLGQDFNRMADDLERQHELRQQLLHDVAHELRTPLTALQCRLETVIDGMSKDPSQAVRDLHENVRHLSALVDDLQNVAEAEAHTIRLDIGDHDAGDLVRAALRATGLESDPRVHVEVPAALVVHADRRRLLQVLSNLLTNANRHTPDEGRITVTATASPGAVTMAVANTGSRLSAEECVRVFDRFYRTDPARQRTTGGTGLGLAIVKHLVEAHGGTVMAQSGGGGVVFTVTLPDAARG
jgi:signal transduction histidine kinase